MVRRSIGTLVALAACGGPGDVAPGDDASAPACAAIDGVSYATLPTVGAITDRPAAQHGDLNLGLRGLTSTGGTRALIDLSGPTDDRAPRLDHLFADDRVPTIVDNLQVDGWDWGCNCATDPLTSPEVTAIAAATTVGEILEAPSSGYDIGSGFTARVLYVDDDDLTLKYTGDDNVVSGYTIHLRGVCVEPQLRALYDASNAAGRSALPALRGDQPLGRARGDRVVMTIRDTGAFMDPRSRKDWWP